MADELREKPCPDARWGDVAHPGHQWTEGAHLWRCDGLSEATANARRKAISDGMREINRQLWRSGGA